MNIATLAAEMKAKAEEIPMDMEQMMAGIATLRFPPELKRIESVDGFGTVQIQFSHDKLSAGKFIRHLSYQREDHAVPSEEMQRAFREAFFDNEENLMPMPSMHGRHVIQLGKLELNNA